MSSGKLRGVSIGHAQLESDELHELVHPLVDPRAIPPEQAGHGGDVLANGAVREQANLLDDVPDAEPEDVRLYLERILPVDLDPSRCRLDKAVYKLEGRRLPTSRRADEGDDLTTEELERKVSDRRRGGPEEGLGDFVEPDHDPVCRRVHGCERSRVYWAHVPLGPAGEGTLPPKRSKLPPSRKNFRGGNLRPARFVLNLASARLKIL